MGMVKIDTDTILVKPLKSRKDPELTKAYTATMLQLKRAWTISRKHILDNKVPEAMKNVMRDK